ncbi:MAG: electron transfer flavoprotein-ubiquinone oxidoreductase [Saprospiraceae bacterium]|nr:electron transfer flavoprotein-ubiquinone oxidoreductase [Saprospiraceae bacterium]
MKEIKTVDTDILIIGGGPAGLATAIHLADLTKPLPVKIMLLEKGGAIGNHILSGAVIDPGALRALLPDIAEKDMPFEAPVAKEEVMYFTSQSYFASPVTLPYFDNKGNYVASLGKITRWLADIAEKKGVQIFPGFSAAEILYDNGRVAGVRTAASGIDKHGEPMPNYQPPTDVLARLTILAEGTRGSLTKTLVRQFNLDKGRNPQIYSLGVKEVWEIPEGRIEPGYVAHSMGYPLSIDQFGGAFIYGMSKTVVALGLAVGLDYADPTFDPHHAFQIYKKHPFVAKLLQGGKILRYGAKTIPEGGYFAIPQLYHDNVMIVGDSAGLVAMPSLKGIHLAIYSGMLAAKTAFEALQKGDTSQQQLRRYEELFRQSPIYKALYPVRNFRQGFKSNLIAGMMQFGTQLVTGGRGFSLSGKLEMAEDYKHYDLLKNLNGTTFQSKFNGQLVFDKKTTFDKETNVFYSGTKHDEEQPSHIQVPNLAICQECIDKYNAPCQGFCPANVFEIVTELKTGAKSLVLHPSNCVHCKTCDIKDPFHNVTWTTPYGGDGPEYVNM